MIALPVLEEGKEDTNPVVSHDPSESVATVTLFRSRNYKLCVSVGVSRDVLAPFKAVFDTGAGPNLVRERILPTGTGTFHYPKSTATTHQSC
jgi:hypothetical protein